MNAKARFIASPFRKDFEAISKTEAFQVACEYALLAMVDDLSRGTNLNESWDNNSRLVGARDFVDILKTLHQPKQERAPLRGEELGYDNIPDFSGAPKS